MKESLDLFATILAYPWFKKKSIILFLNKTDLFDQKIQFSNIGDYFEDYTGEPHDPEQVTASKNSFVCNLYVSTSSVDQ